MASDTTELLAELKQADYVRYTATLFAPEDKRPALATLYLFQADIERIRDLISEPLPGEIRLQWWRDVFMGMRDGEAQQSPLASALLATIDANGLARERFTAYLDAMEFDLYDDPMPSKADFEGFMGETQSVFIQMTAQVLNGSVLPSGDAGGHAGVAYGVMRCLTHLDKHRARGQIYVPRDMLEGCSIEPKIWLASGDVAAKSEVIRQFAQFGADHVAKAREAMTAIPSASRAAFLAISVCDSVFGRAKKVPEAFLTNHGGLSRLRVQWSMFKAALR
ncbi:MAG: phytoene/squalene synthase family protein [Pseudomonadota bacterium]